MYLNDYEPQQLGGLLKRAHRAVKRVVKKPTKLLKVVNLQAAFHGRNSPIRYLKRRQEKKAAKIQAGIAAEEAAIVKGQEDLIAREQALTAQLQNPVGTPDAPPPPPPEPSKPGKNIAAVAAGGLALMLLSRMGIL